MKVDSAIEKRVQRRWDCDGETKRKKETARQRGSQKKDRDSGTERLSERSRESKPRQPKLERTHKPREYLRHLS